MNKIIISGIVTSEVSLSHSLKGKDFYTFDLSSRRKSETEDILPCTCKSDLVENIHQGDKIKFEGQIRSRNIESEDGKKHLSLYLYIHKLLDTTDDEADCNDVELDGFICKAPRYRDTPLKREITDLLIACNRVKRVSDYIPCICWGRNARYAETLPVGTELNIKGRFQSRTYYKRFEDGTSEERTTYELSCSSIKVVESQNDESESKDSAEE